MEDATQKLKAELIDQIDDFQTRQAKADFDFDKFASSLAAKWLGDQSNDQLHDIGRLMIDLATKHFFMFRVFELKLMQVLTGIQFAAKSENPTVIVNAGAILQRLAGAKVQQ